MTISIVERLRNFFQNNGEVDLKVVLSLFDDAEQKQVKRILNTFQDLGALSSKGSKFYLEDITVFGPSKDTNVQLEKALTYLNDLQKHLPKELSKIINFSVYVPEEKLDFDSPLVLSADNDIYHMSALGILNGLLVSLGLPKICANIDFDDPMETVQSFQKYDGVE